MGELHTLRDLVILFAVAVAVVVLLSRLRLPAIAGFLVAGAVAGPAALGLIPDRENVEQLAELGVIALLFGIGLELPLSKLRKLWKPVLIGGALQMALTMAAAIAIARYGGLDFRPAVLVGAVIAVSSTAIVLRALQDRSQVEAPHGRTTLSILVFQDLCVVPLMMLVPFLAGEGGGVADLGMAFLRAGGVLVLVLFGGRLAVRRILQTVARTRQQGLFVLTVLLICLGTAWLAAQAGVSLALGAFLAGMIVADSEYRHQALSDLIPFREAFTSLFFLSVGMLLDPRVLLDDALPIGAMAGGVIVGKFLVMMALCALMRMPLRVAILVSASRKSANFRSCCSTRPPASACSIRRWRRACSRPRWSRCC
jgi:CPA2 family monovalent cation:H+ antiporter-2